MYQIGVSPSIFEQLPANTITLLAAEEIAEYLSRFSVCPACRNRDLDLVAFGYAVHNDRLLVVGKPSGDFLGFGRKCVVSQEYRQQSLSYSLAESLYEELDTLAPGASYMIEPAGFIHAARRECDRFNLGVLYRVDLSESISDRQVGEYQVRMVPMVQIAQQSFSGWSSLIAKHLIPAGHSSEDKILEHCCSGQQ